MVSPRDDSSRRDCAFATLTSIARQRRWRVPEPSWDPASAHGRPAAPLVYRLARTCCVSLQHAQRPGRGHHPNALYRDSVNPGIAGDKVGRPPHQRSLNYGIVTFVRDPRPRRDHQRHYLCKRCNLLGKRDSRGFVDSETRAGEDVDELSEHVE